ncbi:MAG: hypothetical protein Q8O93_01505 [bacterium]|nr:hypothetical protein [bacterium]
MQKTIIGFIIALLVVGAGSFYGGMLYGKGKGGAQNSAFGQRQSFGANGTGGALRIRNGSGGNLAAGGGFVNGDIIAKDDKSITVKLPDGGSKIVFLSDSVQVMKSVSGALADLAVGENVTVSGGANADGSITAQTIQLRTAASTPRQ